MSLQRRAYAYTKMDMEDPEERVHRRAQFLIYKVMERVDSEKRRQSCLRMRIGRLKVKIGKRLKKLRKRILCTISVTKVDVYRQLMCQLKAWKRLLTGGGSVVSLPPLFT